MILAAVNLLALLLLFLHILTAAHSLQPDVAPKRYRVDLDLAPELRWAEVIRDHNSSIPLVVEEAQ